ncbi:NAD(P)/FAD-dependent oxidoreductase [Beijerinckia sp. L45]|uniref:FAD-dependent oxidoreductase n=1 Tax=Beijerinckia sp. L45 TaxID=1641855 RepID=UPI00131D4F3E
MSRRVEIVGAGFSGLASACALRMRGWDVRVHERSTELRASGAGIYLYENGLRVLETFGALDRITRGARPAPIREIRDQQDRLISTHKWDDSVRVYCVARQLLIDSLAESARQLGCEIVTSSEAAGIRPNGELCFTDGRVIEADLVVAADGVNSKIRDSLNLLETRRPMLDGAIRVMIDKTKDDLLDGKTIEYWSGSRRVLYTPCSQKEIYVCLTMLHRDTPATTVPLNKDEWKRSFPNLSTLIDRLGDDCRYDRFECIQLRRWSHDNVAVLGDAAHALPPNIGQGAGCGMMNALSMSIYLDRYQSVREALGEWERRERPLTDHTQRVSVILGLPTNWPSPLRALFFRLVARSRWASAQRTRTARHRPLGSIGSTSASLRVH